MRRRINSGTVIIILLLILLGVMYFTKPDNKTIIIQSVTRMWGKVTPPTSRPTFYEEFMDLNSKSVTIHDWIFFKTIKYHIGNLDETIGFAAFGKVYFTNSKVLHE
jgi:hypothetical protein